jgi:hypothetical protein
VGNLVFERKRILGGLKAYLRATDHTSSNIISREDMVYTLRGAPILDR